jgi:hypothetical protein
MEPLWQNMSADEAGAVLVSAYGEDAGGEALMRAFILERDCNRAGALFWITVHGLIAKGEEATGLRRQ